jgi:tRNA (cytidine/uridine-2'-O-)-methyltransferase
VHDDTAAFLQSIGRTPCWFFDSKGELDLWSTDFRDGDCLIFGSETSGVPESILRSHPDRIVRIPQVQGERCLNLATAAGIALYEALRRLSLTSGRL